MLYISDFYLQYKNLKTRKKKGEIYENCKRQYKNFEPESKYADERI